MDIDPESIQCERITEDASYEGIRLRFLGKLGILNSRMKDFYDIWLLSRLYDFDDDTLTEAIRMTCERRGTRLSPNIEAFTESFMDARQIF